MSKNFQFVTNFTHTEQFFFVQVRFKFLKFCHRIAEQLFSRGVVSL